MICRAMDLLPGSSGEVEWLPKLAALRLTTIVIPRKKPITLLEDFQTVLGTLRADGKGNNNSVITRRQYLLDAQFGVILAGDPNTLEQAAEAIKNPLRSIWLGRKSCVPSEPIFRGLLNNLDGAYAVLLNDALITNFTRQEEVTSFDAGTDSFNDQPVSFGPVRRVYTLRRVRLLLGREKDG